MADGATGALAGFAGINPWVGLGMMGASAITSGIQAISRGSKAKKLEADFDSLDKSLQPVSPEQYAYLNRVRQLERGMRMGTDPTTAMARRGLGQSLAQTQTNIARVGGGPSTVSGLLRAQQGYNVGMGNVAAQAGQQADRMLMFQQPLIDNIQNRIYDLQMKRRNYAQIKAVAMREGAQDAASAAVGALAQGATMIPELNKSIDITKLDGDALSKMNPNKYGVNPSLLPRTYKYGDLGADGLAQNPYAGFGFNSASQPSLASQFGGFGVGLDPNVMAPPTPFTLP